MLGIVLLEAWVQDRELLPLVARFDPRFEGSLHAWLGSMLLGGCAVTLLLIHQHLAPCQRFRWHWLVLAAGFAALSIDEIVQVHETLAVISRWLFGPSSSSNFWAAPGLIGASAVGLAYRSFLVSLLPEVRRRFLMAAVVYLGGALGMELLGGVYEAALGASRLGYVLLAVFEESLELVGAGLFLAAVLDCLEAQTQGMPQQTPELSASRGLSPAEAPLPIHARSA